MGTKLIEVALPLDAINAAAAREKSIRHGHPSTLHLWWARRPLAACRAVLFASLVDDPGSDPTLSEAEVTAKRDELFALIEDLVKWENSNNPAVLARARAAIMESTGGNPPPVLDPFCGGGSIPLEAQRLGLEAHGSDLNPVAVLITKALIEIPPKFAAQAPVNPEARRSIGGGTNWPGATGLAADVRHYGAWMRDEAQKRIGHLYPKAKLPPEQGGGEATVIAWLWARTVTCPNPACGAQMPLVNSFWLSTKAGRKAWVEPNVDQETKKVDFEVRTGTGNPPAETVTRTGAKCIVCETPVTFAFLRSEGQAGRIRSQLLAIVADRQRERMYLAPDRRTTVGNLPESIDPLSTSLPDQALGFRVQAYGMTEHRHLFTPRQLVALTTFSDLVTEVREQARIDANVAGLPDDDLSLEGGGLGASAYAGAIATYLAFAVDRFADYWSGLTRWQTANQQLSNTFGRQALSMVWDYPEPNPFSGRGGSFDNLLAWTVQSLPNLITSPQGHAHQCDATKLSKEVGKFLVSTDPPYYDNIGYADLSDFF